MVLHSCSSLVIICYPDVAFFFSTMFAVIPNISVNKKEKNNLLLYRLLRKISNGFVTSTTVVERSTK